MSVTCQVGLNKHELQCMWYDLLAYSLSACVLVNAVELVGLAACQQILQRPPDLPALWHFCHRHDTGEATSCL